MTGWQARSCRNLHGMYKWFCMVPQGLVLCLPFVFLVIFGALSCDIRGGVLRVISCSILVGCHVWGTCPCASLAGDFALRTPFNRPRFGGFSSCSRSWPREPRSGDSLWLRAFRCDSFGGEDAKEVTQVSPKLLCNPWGESGDRAMGSWGLTRN
jgi:hypothetical protein